jgi:hypothetical protein
MEPPVNFASIYLYWLSPLQSADVGGIDISIFNIAA